MSDREQQQFLSTLQQWAWWQTEDDIRQAARREFTKITRPEEITPDAEAGAMLMEDAFVNLVEQFLRAPVEPPVPNDWDEANIKEPLSTRKPVTLSLIRRREEFMKDDPSEYITLYREPPVLSLSFSKAFADPIIVERAEWQQLHALKEEREVAAAMQLSSVSGISFEEAMKSARPPVLSREKLKAMMQEAIDTGDPINWTDKWISAILESLSQEDANEN